MAAFEPVVALLREGEVGRAGRGPGPRGGDRRAAHARATSSGARDARADELDAAARLALAPCRHGSLPWPAAGGGEGDTDAALGELSGRGRGSTARLDMPFALARTELALGERRSDEPSSAPPRGRRWWRPRRRFEAAGRRRRWADTARAAEAARLGGRRPSERRRADGGPNAASPSWPRRAAQTERSRASCSSPSARWRRISRAVYRKLGVRSRTELARRLP